jgi:uncharacterized repeat protein (TIGR03803 family)
MATKKPLLVLLSVLSIGSLVATGAASTYKVQHRFTGKDGENPAAGLVVDGAGNLYGTTLGGGGTHNCGTVFKLAPAANGKLRSTVLHYFSGGKDGCQSYAGVILDEAGNLYGTTSANGMYGGGSVFRLSAGANGKWTETVLHSFSGEDGDEARAGLIFDSSGNLYGTTGGGGAFGQGTVFQLSPKANGRWSEKVLYSFCSASNCSDGAQPLAGVIFDSAGNLYGTTSVGGGNGCGNGCGTVFRLSASNGHWTETVLHSFNFTDGARPVANLVLDGAGNLYGTAIEGGLQSCSGGCGTVFQISPGALSPTAKPPWSGTVLYNFCSMPKCKDGASPAAGLTFDASGNLIGTTISGGYCGLCGTVFRLSPGPDGQWTETVLRLFGKPAAGRTPYAAVTLDTTGNVYGTTQGGGNTVCGDGCGVVFEITP